jgi:HAD superfamily hydrolase (TIGR01549 family)
MITAGADIKSVYHATGPYNERVRSRHTPLTVLFDLDDTLFDHQASARQALRVVHASHPSFSRWPFDDFDRTHARFLEELHVHVLSGSIGIDDAREERFRRLFEAAGVEAEAARLTSTAASYRAAYLAARAPVPGAQSLLAALAPRVRIGIVSNNLLEEQRDKVRLCGFEPFVDALVVSEEEGVSKPDPEIFRRALARLQTSPDEAVMIGDSWTADIEGAIAAGIRAIWFTRASAPSPNSNIVTLTTFDPIEPVLEAIFPCVLA